MSRNIRVIFVILSLIFVVFTWRIIQFYIDVNTVPIKDKPEAPTFSKLSDEYYSFGDNGFYGVKERSGKIIIEARWNEIVKLGADRFAVSGYTSKGLRYGIIDTGENVVVPFIYKSLKNYSDEFLCGTTESGTYVLFDNCGNALINEEWDSFSKNYNSKSLKVSGNYIQLEKEKNLYRISLDENGRFIMPELWLLKDVFGEKQIIKVKNSSVLLPPGDVFRMYNEIFDTGIDYIDAIFSNDSAAVKSLSWNEDYRDILLDGLNLRGSTVIHLGTPVPVISDNENGSTDYSCSTSVIYESPDNIQWDGTYTNTSNLIELEILMKKNMSGKLAVYKVHARKTDVPDEYKTNAGT